MEVDFETDDIGSDDFEIAPGDIEINKYGPVPVIHIDDQHSLGFGISGRPTDPSIPVVDSNNLNASISKSLSAFMETILEEFSDEDDEDYELNNDMEEDDKGDVEKDFFEEDDNVDPYMLP
ncbi:hypothetical protein GH714_003730 [Hevea brasiliensis]|uniref:Uncharacterized protein n=1 Tax=Hevea brasiliensis TaxID=3981 RepID=A0A6A6KQE1_HEVBR|nr:hypothetical protein GH714_003730 [Hevea brasiliensis]